MVKYSCTGALPDSQSGDAAPNSGSIRGVEHFNTPTAPMENDMADRTWNQVDARIYSDMDCSEEAVIIWAYLLAVCPNQYGVYDLPLPAMRRFFGRIISPEKILECFQELVDYGCMKLYDEGKIIWIRKKFKRERKASATRDQRKGALGFIGEHYPAVLNDFASLYPVIGESTPSDTPVIPQTTEADSDTEAKKNTSPKRKAAALPSLPDLEDQIHKDWLPEWIEWRNTVLIARNKSCEMKESVIVRALQQILKMERQDHLSPAAMVHGFNAAIRKGADKENYILQAARGYVHNPTAGQTNGEYYGTEKPALSAAEREQSDAEHAAELSREWQALCERSGYRLPDGYTVEGKIGDTWHMATADGIPYTTNEHSIFTEAENE